MKTSIHAPRRRGSPHSVIPLTLLTFLLIACAQPMPRTGASGADGAAGKDGVSCKLATGEEGTRTLTCDDGTEVVLKDGVDGVDGVDGADGVNGTSCTATDNGDGSKTIACEDGTEVVVSDGAICDVQSVVDNGNGTETLSCLGGFDIIIATRTPIEPCVATVLDAAAPWPTNAPKILGVCADSRTVVFTTFQSGTPRTAVPSELSFVMAKLVPGAAGTPDNWQSYLNRKESPGNGAWPVTNVTQVQATRESNGTLKAVKPGIYAYTFSSDIQNITSPIAVAYQPSLTHRVAVEFRGSMGDLGAGNLWYDWRPSGGAVALTRNVATTSSCKACHSGFEMHGGRAKDVEVCTVCHNPGTTDANSGNSLDLKVMVHKIHAGKNLPSVVAGGEYAIWGYGNQKYDFSKVKHPQDIRNCAKCHDGGTTTNGDNWKNKADVATCTSCHDNKTFTSAGVTTGVTLHTGGAFTSGCTGCHSTAGFAKDIEVAHRTLVSTPHNPSAGCRVWGVNQVCSQEFPVFEHDLINVSLTGSPATQVTAKFAVLADGVPLVLNALPAGVALTTSLRVFYGSPFTYGGGASQLVSTLADPADFNRSTATYDINRSFANLVAQAVRDPGDGTYTILLGTVAANAKLVSVNMTGRATVDGQTITIESVIKGVEMDTPARRQIADKAGCLNCHERMDTKHNDRVGDPDTCVGCHNPTYVSGTRSRTMSHMIHRVHTGRHERADYAGLVFPGNLANCKTCHLAGTYELPIPQNAVALSLTADYSARVSPTGAACTACHDSPQAKLHANTASAVDGLFSAATDQCSVCHGPGASFDVKKVHGIE